MSKASAAMLLTASAFVLNTAAAKAADFGGDCCADLEERIAAARKGNRKVSLEISGHINEGIMVWDDGVESNAYVVTNDAGRTRFRFRGKAKISCDLSAGYLLEFGVRAARSDRVDQDSDDPGAAIDIRHSNWYLKSKSLGKIQVGEGSGAGESITEANITQTKDIAKNSDPEDHAAGFQLRNAATGAQSGLEWRRPVKDNFIQPGEGSRGSYVAYSSPKFGGFSFHASWGEDDFWETSIKYMGELHGIKIAAGIGYGQNTDENGFNGRDAICMARGKAECYQYGGSFSALHKASGLFLTFGAGKFVDENIEGDADFAGADADDESTFYSFQAGVEKQFIPLGTTTVYGGGVIQGIDAAEMRLYAFWRHFEAEAKFTNSGNVDLEDLDVFMAGALIEF